MAVVSARAATFLSVAQRLMRLIAKLSLVVEPYRDAHTLTTGLAYLPGNKNSADIQSDGSVLP